VTAGAAQIFVVIKDHYLASREGKFSALYAALFFEQYADLCSQRFGEKEAYDVTDRRVGADHNALPELADFPKEIDWHKVGIAMTEEAFAFRVAVNAAELSIFYHYQNGSPEVGDRELKRCLARLGLAALDVATRLRDSAKLTLPPDDEDEFTTENYLTSAQEKLDEIDRQRAEARREEARLYFEANPHLRPDTFEQP
jgi:hypothetical protein